MSQPAAAPVGGAQASTAGVDKVMKEYTLKAAGGSPGQMFHVARFSQASFDFGKLSQPTRM